MNLGYRIGGTRYVWVQTKHRRIDTIDTGVDS